MKPDTALALLRAFLGRGRWLVLLSLALLAGCPEPFGPFDNKYDEDSPQYQGYPAVENPGDIDPVTPDISGAAYAPRLVALTIAGADRYGFRASRDETFASVDVALECEGNECSPADWPTLVAGALYYWQARARKDGSWGPWTSTEATFALSAPALGTVLPGDGAASADTSPDFDWADLPDAVSYRFQLASDAAFTALVRDASDLAASAYAATPPLGNDRSYWWRIAARNAEGASSAWSVARSFSVSWNPAISPIGPDDGGSTNDTTPTLSWSAVADADGYDLRIAATSGGLAAADVIDAQGSTYTIDAAIPNGGTRHWSVTPYNADGVRGATRGPWSFVIDIGTPTLSAPLDASSTVDTKPSFSWSSVEDADRYHLQLSTDPSFATVALEDAALAVTTFMPGLPLSLGSTYHWRVAARVGGVWGSWSSSRSLFVGVPTPTLSTPAAGASVADATPAFDWAVLPDVAGYQLQVASAADFATILATADLAPASASSHVLATPLTDLGSYWWRVRAQGTDGSFGSWSAARSFSVALPKPSLLSPSGKITDTTPDFDWTDVMGSTEYRFQLSSFSSFSTRIIDLTGLTVSAYVFDATALSLGGTYYWRVSTRFADGAWSAWSPVATFLYDLPIPARPDLAAADDSGLSDSDNVTNRTSALGFQGSLPEAGLTVRLYSDLDGLLGETVAGSGGAWSLAVSLSSAAGSRTHNVTATCVAGSSESAPSPALAVTVDTTAPAVPNGVPRIKTPRVGARTGLDLSPYVTWFPCSDPVDGYWLEADDDPNFGSPEFSQLLYGGSTASYQVPSLPISTSPPVGRRYYLRVRGIDLAGNPTASPAPTRYLELGRVANDFNGDGYSDLVAGAYGYDLVGGTDSNEGRIYILHGGPAMEAIPDLSITGGAAGRQLGKYYASGDFNADGFADLVANDGTVYLGGASMDEVPDLQLTVPAGSIAIVASAGDFNGDGYGDIATQSVEYSYYVVRVFLGGTELDASPDIFLEPQNKMFFFGGALDSAGDLNLDGYDDLLVGDSDYDDGLTDRGATFVYFGGAGLDGSNDGLMLGTGDHYNFGHSVSTAGDFNGDGYADAISTMPAASSNLGVALLFYGGPGVSFNTTVDQTLSGSSAGEQLGVSVAGGGDLDGDGYDDVIVGSAAYMSGTGRFTIFWGSAGVPASLSSLTTVSAGDYYGHHVQFVGDCNGDGLADFAAGAYGEDANGSMSGSMYLYFGRASKLMPLWQFGLHGERAGDYLGYGHNSIGY